MARDITEVLAGGQVSVGAAPPPKKLQEGARLLFPQVLAIVHEYLASRVKVAPEARVEEVALAVYRDAIVSRLLDVIEPDTSAGRGTPPAAHRAVQADRQHRGRALPRDEAVAAVGSCRLEGEGMRAHLAPLVALVLAASGCGSDGPGTCNVEAPYLACACGCCVGANPTVRCLAPGEDLCDIVAQDRAQAASTTCATAGCAVGVEHRVCP
jgi:hypothetical protein